MDLAVYAKSSSSLLSACMYVCLCVCVLGAAGYPAFLPQMPAHVALAPELCPRELLPLSAAAAAAALGSISPGASLPYASRPSLVSLRHQYRLAITRMLSGRPNSVYHHSRNAS